MISTAPNSPNPDLNHTTDSNSNQHSNLITFNNNPALLSSETAINALVVAQGNVELAAENLHVKPADFVAIITQDPNAYQQLQLQLRTLTLLRAFESLNLTSLLYSDALLKLEPKDLAKAYASLLETMRGLTDTKESTQNINITETAIRLLPLPIRNAMLTLMGPSQEAIDV